MYDRIGELIARRRKELGMNQAQLAASMNKMGFSLSNQAVSKWENGSTLPNARQFLALCDALGVDDIRGVFSGRGEGLLSGLDREGRKLAGQWPLQSGAAAAQSAAVLPGRLRRDGPISGRGGL